MAKKAVKKPTGGRIADMDEKRKALDMAMAHLPHLHRVLLEIHTEHVY